MKIDLIAGARPNFVKIAALINAFKYAGKTISYRLIHTGQHYDDVLSGSFFQDLQIPQPDINLGVGSGTQAEQTAAIMMAYEKILQNYRPDYCLVVGDVTSSMACAVTAKKMQVKVIHIEAGLRSYDWTMPEEVNRVLIDSISDYYFTTTRQAKNSLLQIGKTEKQVFFVGNTMIDTLLRFQTQFRKPEIWNSLKLEAGNYLIITLHRPGNVDEAQKLKLTLNTILEHSGNIPVVFPVHPRTAKIVKSLNLHYNNLFLTESLSYLEFNYLVENATAILTDSGGITEETTVLGIPCLTLRENTERPETIYEGTNELVGSDPRKIAQALKIVLLGEWKKGNIPELWDGKAAIRITDALNRL